MSHSAGSLSSRQRRNFAPCRIRLPGDVVEGDLDDELGAQALPDELLVGLPAARLARAPLAGAVGLEQLQQLALLLGA